MQVQIKQRKRRIIFERCTTSRKTAGFEDKKEIAAGTSECQWSKARAECNIDFLVHRVDIDKDADFATGFLLPIIIHERTIIVITLRELTEDLATMTKSCT